MRRWTFFAFAVGVTVLFFAGMLTFWVPAHSGVDQNGYLFGGRQIAQAGTMKFAPVDPKTGEFDPHQFVGRMWVGADHGLSTERFYPKYPIGLPLLVAIVLKLGGPDWGPWAVYLINPVAMSLAVLATFLLLRTFCGSFLALLGQLVFATSPVVMLLSIDPNSHATAVFCVAWGMVGLFAWWKRGHPVIGFLAGLLLGYAVTIRYTEATLLLPVVLVITFRLGLISKWWRIPVALTRAGIDWLRRRDGSRGDKQSLSIFHPVSDWIGAALIVFGWLIPVAGLLIYNLVAMGTPTGYDPTNESKPGASFNLDHALDNWETTLRHLAVNGLFFLFPIAILGLGWMFSWRRKPALVMAAWIVPCLAAYTFYYWAPDPQTSTDPRTPANLGVSIGYLRFFTTVLPALAACGIWAMGHLTELVVARTHHWSTRLAAYAAVPVVVFLSCAVHVHNNARDLETVQYSRLNLQTNVTQVLAAVPEGSAIFYHDHGLFHHLQFVRNYLLFDTQTYRESWVKRLLANVDPDDAQGLDPGRSKSMHERLKDFDQRQLDEQQRQAAVACLESGRRVFVIEGPVPRSRDRRPRQMNDVVRRLTAKPVTEGASQLHADVVARWRFIVVPAAVSWENRDDNPPKRHPRQRRIRVQTANYDTPWLIYEITKTPPEKLSPEMQAIADYEAEQKAKDAALAAERQAAEKARREAEAKRREAEAKRREEEQKRQAELRQAEQDRLKRIQEQQRLLKELETKLSQTQTAYNKATADLKSTTQQIATLKEQHAVATDAVKRAAADRQTIEAELAKQRSAQQQLAKELDDRTKALAAAKKTLAETEKQLAEAKAALDRARAEEARVKAETARLKSEAEQVKQSLPTTQAAR